MKAAYVIDTPLPAICPGTAAVVAIGPASTQSVAINSQIVRLLATADCHVVFGEDPAATGNDTPLPANLPEYFVFVPGHKVAVIQDSATGVLYITPAA